MTTVHLQYLSPDHSDGSVAVDVLLRQEPDEEEEDEEEDEGDGKEDEDDDDEDDDGYSERFVLARTVTICDINSVLQEICP